MLIGCALVRKVDGAVRGAYPATALVNVQFDGEGLWVAAGWENDKYALVERVTADPPANYGVLSESEAFDGERVVVTREYQLEPPVPPSVSAAQAKTALFNAGLLDTVETAIADAYRPVRIYYFNAPTWERNHPYLLGMAAQVGLTDEQTDQLMQEAAAL